MVHPGFNKLIVLAFVLIFIITLPVMVAYRMVKQRGRLEEMERQRMEPLQTTGVSLSDFILSTNAHEHLG